MKSLLSLFLPVILFCSCGGPSSNGSAMIKSRFDVWLDVKGNLPGVEVSDLHDRYDSRNGEYAVFAMVKNNSKETFKYLQLDAAYMNLKNNELATSLARTDKSLAPGDSAVIKNYWLIPDGKAMPFMVNLTLTK